MLGTFREREQLKQKLANVFSTSFKKYNSLCLLVDIRHTYIRILISLSRTNTDLVLMYCNRCAKRQIAKNCILIFLIPTLVFPIQEYFFKLTVLSSNVSGALKLQSDNLTVLGKMIEF